MAFCLLLGLYTVVLLDKFESTISVTEWVLAAWFLALLLVELHEVKFIVMILAIIIFSRKVFEQGFREWSRDLWNVIDTLVIGIYYASFFVRVYSTSQYYDIQAAKTIMSVNSILLFLRLLHYYGISKVLGPKIVMIGRMFNDLIGLALVIYAPCLTPP